MPLTNTADGSKSPRQIGSIQEIKLLKQGHQYLSEPVAVAFFKISIDFEVASTA